MYMCTTEMNKSNKNTSWYFKNTFCFWEIYKGIALSICKQTFLPISGNFIIQIKNLQGYLAHYHNYFEANKHHNPFRIVFLIV